MKASPGRASGFSRSMSDVFAKAGGALRAYVETVNVEVTDGKLDIKFTPNVENPEINGIEIVPNP
jgi:hypothetical protein